MYKGQWMFIRCLYKFLSRWNDRVKGRLHLDKRRKRILLISSAHTNCCSAFKVHFLYKSSAAAIIAPSFLKPCPENIGRYWCLIIIGKYLHVDVEMLRRGRNIPINYITLSYQISFSAMVVNDFHNRDESVSSATKLTA